MENDIWKLLELLYRGSIGGYLGTMERNMETTIIYRGYIGGL